VDWGLPWSTSTKSTTKLFIVAGFPPQLFLIELDLTPLSGTVETPTVPRRRFY
jgi:hypothetical protein